MKIDPPAPPALGPTRLLSKAGTPALPGTGEAGAAQPSPKESAPMSGQVRSLPSAPGASDFDAARVAAIPSTYILTYVAGGPPDAFERFALRASKLGMHVVRIVGDHTPHRSQPKHLVELLVGN